jgi:hypothetical protein
MTYDAARQRVVLFGGTSSRTNYLGDTWEWDGTTWTQRAPAASPSAREVYAMAFDAVRQRAVMFGGAVARLAYVSDTWEWDGANWVQLAPATIPRAGVGQAMAYDPSRQCVVMFGSYGNSYSADTWLFGQLARAAAVPIGTGCPGTSGTPVLSCGDPFLGNEAFRLDVLSARASSPCLFGLAAATQALGFGPCTLYLVEPIVALPAGTNAAGFATTTRIAVPNDVALRGAPVFGQAFVADPQAPVLGIAFSAGARMTIGL